VQVVEQFLTRSCSSSGYLWPINKRLAQTSRLPRACHYEKMTRRVNCVERRLAITYIVSATATFGIGCVAIAATTGALFASAAPNPLGGKQVEIIDDYIVVHSPTTEVVVDTSLVAAEVAAAASAGRATLARSVSAAPTTAAPAPATIAEPTPTEAPAPAPSAEQVSAPAPAPAPAPKSAPAPSPAPAPTPEPEPEDQPPHTTVAPAPPSPTVRPPIPPGCKEPEWDHGRWKCDGDD
jgi:outer membrane biosynthesis protein TonB